ncbi:MAG TPA: hypothetical protein VFV52_04070 [Bacilli bacterium]|nr:hypothetical protein [Bacilli bacterium]
MPIFFHACVQVVVGGFLILLISSFFTVSIAGGSVLHELIDTLPIWFAFTFPALVMGGWAYSKVNFKAAEIPTIKIQIQVFLMNAILFITILPTEVAYLALFTFSLLVILLLLHVLFGWKRVWEVLFACSSIATAGFLSSVILSFLDPTTSAADRLEMDVHSWPLVLFAGVSFFGFRKILQ